MPTGDPVVDDALERLGPAPARTSDDRDLGAEVVALAAVHDALHERLQATAPAAADRP